jgi:hypothetical protein
MKILLVEPEYYTKYPPLGLLKLASYYRSRGNEVKLVRGLTDDSSFIPDKIEITSLFTYAWLPVHKAVEYYSKKYPNAKIRVGGIYATLMNDRIKDYFPSIEIHQGLFHQSEQYLPSYDLLQYTEKWEKWNSSILFTSRGCIRKCPYCVVPILEGKIRSVVSNVQDFIYPDYKKIILWDNNFFAAPEWRNAIHGLKETGLKVDFNQGLDVRLIDEEKAGLIAELNPETIRMAYDWVGYRKYVEPAIDFLTDAGIKRKKILFYVLYNFHDPVKRYGDTPDSFFSIIRHIAELGCVSYPMRYEPLDSLKKNQFVSPNWNIEELELVADARRVIGFGGAFPPYKGLVNKFIKSDTFTKCFELYPEKVNDSKTTA